MSGSFEAQFDGLFRTQFPRLFRYLDRLSGDPEMARDLAQDTFIRLLQRGASPDHPEAWLITVGTNLWRNARATDHRRRKLLGPSRVEAESAAVPPLKPEAAEERTRVEQAMTRLPERDRQMLLLMAEGYRYHEIAEATEVSPASVGTLLARAKRAFREAYEGPSDAS